MLQRLFQTIVTGYILTLFHTLCFFPNLQPIVITVIKPVRVPVARFLHYVYNNFEDSTA